MLRPFGALFIALYWMSNFLPLSGKALAYASIVAASGFFGCLMDSALGATVQAHYYDQEVTALQNTLLSEEGNCLWNGGSVGLTMIW